MTLSSVLSCFPVLWCRLEFFYAFCNETVSFSVTTYRKLQCIGQIIEELAWLKKEPKSQKHDFCFSLSWFCGSSRGEEEDISEECESSRDHS